MIKGRPEPVIVATGSKPTSASKGVRDGRRAPLTAVPAGTAAPSPALGQLPPVVRVPGFTLSPERLLEIQQQYLERLNGLWTDFLEHPEKSSVPIADGRFSDPEWQHNSLSAFLARAYLLNAEFLGELAAAVDAEPKVKARLCFSVSQWLDASAPSNFLAFNPKAQKRMLETKGESLTAGLQNLLSDVAKGRISQVDETAFEVGRNVATTEGAVVFENELIQLIQYKAQTASVRSRPLLIVPPCINKFYILDLQAQNSFIRYCVERGNTVFVVSWRNPHEEQGRLGWDDYLEQGPLEAVRVVRAITGAGQINALGFCVGGTLLATALSVLRARGEDPVASLTLLTSLLDFENAGILDIFIDEAHVRMRESSLGEEGLMPGRDLANTFSSLRANDLVWNYVVNNYLEGNRPPAFDLLYWNADSTNLPGPMYTWYLRNTYLENNLREPGRLHCCGQPVDLGTIQAPTYVFAAREDHIVPWQGAYASARTLSGLAPGQLRFALGASGHIAGTINPATKNRRSFWTVLDAEQGGLPENPQHWLERAVEHPGSWWTDWDRWLENFGGGMQDAPQCYGNEEYAVVEPAPGRYVREQA